MSGQILAAIEQIATKFTESNKATDQRFTQLAERIELIESGRDRPRGISADGTGEKFSKQDHEHKGVFLDWLRKPGEKVRENRLSECAHELSKKDVSIGSNSAGGYALPKEISSQIETRVRQLNPFRQLVDVQTCSTNDFHSLVSMGDGASGWVAETGSRSATSSPTLRDRAPTFGEQYAYPTASEWSLDDLFFDVEQWLVNDVSADWAAQEATAIVSGSGSSRPTGILNSTPTLSIDAASPMRAASTIQYVGLTSFTSPVTINVDSLIVLVNSIAERYLMESAVGSCAFVMNRLTLSALQRTKASTAGTYLWGDATQGRPSTLLGFPVYTCDAMAPVASDNFIVLFGNWYRGYLLVDRVGTRITPNPYSTPGQVSFYCRRRLGGIVKNNDALKALRCSD